MKQRYINRLTESYRLFSTLAFVMALISGTGTAGAQTTAAVPAPAAPAVPKTAAAPATPSTPTAPAAVKDFSKGFAAFYKLGVPDASKAEYVNLTIYQRDPYSMMHNSMGSLYELKLTGNAWMLEETAKVKGRFISDNLEVVEVFDNNALVKEKQKKWEDAQKTNKNENAVMDFYAEDDDPRIGGVWKKMELKKDVEKTVAFLDKQDKEKSRGYDRLSYGDAYGVLFLNAMHYYSKGFTNEANLIVGRLFERSGDPKKVLGQAMSLLAESKYETAYKKFRTDGNWENFSKELDAMTAQFGTSWQKVPAVKKLSLLVKQRAAQTQAPALTAEGLTEADKALAAELATATLPKENRYYGQGGELWLLPQPKQRMMPGKTKEKEEKNILNRIKKTGVKAVPMLLAMLKDDYLTRIDLHEIAGRYGYSRSFDMSSMGDGTAKEEIIQKMYDSMQRPASRADIAAGLLKPLIMKKDDRSGRSSEMGRDELAEEIKAWYEANKAKTPIELARAYMEGGSDNQQREAMQYLIKSGNDADMAQIEKHFLEGSGESRTDTYAVRQFVEARGEKAKAFVEKYEAMITQQTTSGDNEMFKNEGYQKQMKAEVAQLKELVSSSSVKEILAQVVAGTKTMEQVSTPLYQKLGKEKNKAETLSAILNAALQAKEADTSMSIIYLSAMMGRQGFMSMMDDMGDDVFQVEDPPAGGPGKTEDKLKPSANAEQWKKLLADKRKIENSIPGMQLTVGDIAATMINSIYGKQEQGQYPYVRGGGTPSMGKRTLAINRKKAEALLEGKPEAELVKLPAIKDITPEQKKAAVAKIMQAADSAIGQVVTALTDQEQLALMLAAKKDDKLNAKLAAYANTVREIEVDPALSAAAAQVTESKGKVVTRDIVEQVRKVCIKLAGEGKIINCSITRQMCLDGVVISVKEVLQDSKAFETMFDAGMIGEKQPASVSGTVADTGCNGNAMWPVGTTAEKAAAAAASETPEDKMISGIIKGVEEEIAKQTVEDQNDFWKAVTEFCAGKGNVCRTGMIMFFGKAPVKAKPKAAAPAAEKKAGAAVPAAAAPVSGTTTTTKITVSPNGTKKTETVTSGSGKVTTTTTINSTKK